MPIQPEARLQAAFSGQRIGVHEWPTDLPVDLRIEWDLVTRAHHNILLAGTPSATSGMIASLMPHLRRPVHQYRLDVDGPMPLPATGALILSEVGALSLDHQAELLQWLDGFHERVPVQIISTTSMPLHPLVESGAFHDGLFYRLNILGFDLTAAGEVVRL